MNRALLRKEKESDKDYFTRVAAYVETLRDAGMDNEIRECFKEIGRWLVPIVEEYIECESAAYRLDDDTKVLFSDKVYTTLIRIFHKYNNPKYMAVELQDCKYEMKTFIKTRCKCCIRDAVAETLCISQADARRLLKIRQAQEIIARDNQISSEDVGIDDIYTMLGGRVSKQDIEELLLIIKGSLSLEVMKEHGQQVAGSDQTDADIFGGDIADDAKSVFDMAFSKCSGLDIYILMQELGYLDEDTNRMHISELVLTERFKRLFDKDTTIRCGSNPVRTVNNKRAKMHKILSGLNGKISVADIEGGTKRYFYNCLMGKAGLFKERKRLDDVRFLNFFLDKLPEKE